jgi:hypothetical protein
MALKVDEPTPFASKQHGGMRPPNPLVDLIFLGLLFEPQIPLNILVEAKRELANPQAKDACHVTLHGPHAPRDSQKFAQNIPSIPVTGLEHFEHLPLQFHQQRRSSKTPWIAPDEWK